MPTSRSRSPTSFPRRARRARPCDARGASCRSARNYRSDGRYMAAAEIIRSGILVRSRACRSGLHSTRARAGFAPSATASKKMSTGRGFSSIVRPALRPQAAPALAPLQGAHERHRGPVDEPLCRPERHAHGRSVSAVAVAAAGSSTGRRIARLRTRSRPCSPIRRLSLQLCHGSCERRRHALPDPRLNGALDLEAWKLTARAARGRRRSGREEDRAEGRHPSHEGLPRVRLRPQKPNADIEAGLAARGRVRHDGPRPLDRQAPGLRSRGGEIREG